MEAARFLKNGPSLLNIEFIVVNTGDILLQWLTLKVPCCELIKCKGL